MFAFLPWVCLGVAGLLLFWGLRSSSDTPGRIGVASFLVAFALLGGSELPAALKGDGFLWGLVQVTFVAGIGFLCLLLLWRSLDDGSLVIAGIGLLGTGLVFLPFALKARSPRGFDLRADVSRLLPEIQKDCLPSGGSPRPSPLLESCFQVARQRWFLQRRIAKQMYPMLRDLEGQEKKRLEALETKLRLPTTPRLTEATITQHPFYPSLRQVVRLWLYRERLTKNLQAFAQINEQASFLLWDLAQQIRLQRPLQASTLQEIQTVGEKLLDAQKHDPLGEITKKDEDAALLRLLPLLPSPSPSRTPPSRVRLSPWPSPSTRPSPR